MKKNKRKQATEADLGYWANTAERGESFVYGYAFKDARPLAATMAAARKLEALGLIALVQRREADKSTSYIAQRTWKRADSTPRRGTA